MAENRAHLTRKELNELIDEISDAYVGEKEDSKWCSEELRYLSDFIHWKRLDEEYRQFRKEAVVEDNPDVPFPRLIMPTEVKSAG